MIGERFAPVASSIALTAGSTPAFAQADTMLQTSDGDTEISDIVVTVQRRSERVQDVLDISSFGSYGFFYNEPRTVGVTLNYKM